MSKPIQQFNKKIADDLSKEVLPLLQAFGAKYGLTVRDHGGNFDATRFTAKFEFGITTTADGKSREQAEFEKYCALFYCEPSDYNRDLVINKKPYKLIGFKPGSSKFNVMVRQIGTDVVTLFNDEVLKKIDRMAPWEREENKVQVTKKNLMQPHDREEGAA